MHGASSVTATTDIESEFCEQPSDRQNCRMPHWVIEYTYDERAHLRDQHRPAHRAYLGGLLATGDMVAFGRYDDAEAPGALLIAEAETKESVEEMVRRDPFVIQGLVPAHRVRRWAGEFRQA